MSHVGCLISQGLCCQFVGQFVDHLRLIVPVPWLKIAIDLGPGSARFVEEVSQRRQSRAMGYDERLLTMSSTSRLSLETALQSGMELTQYR
jgi:hypothetical protein